MSNKRKAQLLSELNKIEDRERKELIEKELPKFQKKYVGKCFKYLNSYGGDGSGKKWWMYIKVLSIEAKDIYTIRENEPTAHYNGYSFQVDCNGNVSIDKKESGYVHSLLNTPIPESEFNKAWNRMIDYINNFK